MVIDLDADEGTPVIFVDIASDLLASGIPVAEPIPALREQKRISMRVLRPHLWGSRLATLAIPLLIWGWFAIPKPVSRGAHYALLYSLIVSLVILVSVARGQTKALRSHMATSGWVLDPLSAAVLPEEIQSVADAAADQLAGRAGSKLEILQFAREGIATHLMLLATRGPDQACLGMWTLGVHPTRVDLPMITKADYEATVALMGRLMDAGMPLLSQLAVHQERKLAESQLKLLRTWVAKRAVVEMALAFVAYTIALFLWHPDAREGFPVFALWLVFVARGLILIARVLKRPQWIRVQYAPSPVPTPPRARNFWGLLPHRVAKVNLQEPLVHLLEKARSAGGPGAVLVIDAMMYDGGLYPTVFACYLEAGGRRYCVAVWDSSARAHRLPAASKSGI